LLFPLVYYSYKVLLFYTKVDISDILMYSYTMKELIKKVSTFTLFLTGLVIVGVLLPIKIVPSGLTALTNTVTIPAINVHTDDRNLISGDYFILQHKSNIPSTTAQTLFYSCQHSTDVILITDNQAKKLPCDKETLLHNDGSYLFKVHTTSNTYTYTPLDLTFTNTANGVVQKATIYIATISKDGSLQEKSTLNDSTTVEARIK